MRHRGVSALKRIKGSSQHVLAHWLVLCLTGLGIFVTSGAAASTIYMSMTGLVFPTMAACVATTDGPAPSGMGLTADGWTHDGAPYINSGYVAQKYWVPAWEEGFDTPGYAPSPGVEYCGYPTSGTCPTGSQDNGTGHCVTTCPAGQTRNQVAGSRTQGQCISTIAPSNLGGICPRDGCKVTGDPVNTGTGNKFQIETDFPANSASPLSFSRTYNSSTSVATTMGGGWQHSYERFITVLNNGSVEAMRSDGKSYVFTLSNGVYTAPDTKDSLQALSGGGWSYVTSDDTTETYNATGILQSITDHAGRTQTLTYSDGTTGPNGGYVLNASGNSTPSTLPSGLLKRVTDASGRTLSFGYDVYARIVLMIDPSGGTYHYGYDEASSIVVSGQYAANNLTSVTYPDGNKRTYWYNEQGNTAGQNLPNALTGITDENGNRYSTTQYNTQGQASITEEGPNMASPAGLYSLAYCKRHKFHKALGRQRHLAILYVQCVCS
ncbi:MAG: DUF6531 domain-containing protein [Thiobacillaceae bacterium]